MNLTKLEGPELLIPAGSLDKLKVAILYGADAVYLGGQKFGLRAAADNFTLEELAQGVAFAHERGKKVYVVLNSYLYDKDLLDLPDFLRFIHELKVDAVIVSDPGVAKLVTNLTSIPLHVSTQASVLNSEAALWWKDIGAKRIVLGREVGIIEASEIKQKTGLEVEMFIHGSMCMAYSGHCVISNFTQGRDSNRGGCAHSCRFEYSLTIDQLETQEKKKAYFMSSKDLMGVHLIQDFAKAGIDSLKVEGRMKSPLYAASTASVYQSALTHYKTHGHVYSSDLLHWENELKKVPHRDYTEASLRQKADESSIFNERETSSDQEWEIAAVVNTVGSSSVILDIKNGFNQGDTLELLHFDGKVTSVPIHEMTDILLNPVTRTKPSTLIRIPKLLDASPWQILRKKKC
jgi:U32 family peptidase